MIRNVALACAASLLASFCSASLRLENLWDKTNIVKCKSNARCASGMLIGCNGEGIPSCRYRCPLGHPLIPHRNGRPVECAATCPGGYHVSKLENVEVCRRHTTRCQPGDSVIVPGSSWHDTICGNPNDYVTPRNLKDTIGSTTFLKTLNDLAATWIRALSESDIAKICDLLFYANRDVCTYNAEHLFAGMGMPFENIFYVLRKVSALKAAKDMYTAVVKPFMRDNVDPTTVSIEFEHPTKFWAEPSKDLMLNASVNIPLGALHLYRPKQVIWATGLHGDRFFLRNLGTHVEALNPRDSATRYSLAKGMEWNEQYTKGFLVHTFDISLLIENYHCDVFEAPVTVTVVLENTLAHSIQQLQKSIDVLCMWKPRLHSDCDCTQALLDYTNPHGLCSPTCVTHPITQTFQGLPDSNNDWTLQLSYTQRGFRPLRSSKRGRIVMGSVTPSTRRFCVVTKDIFTQTPSPRQDVPSAPLDVRRCDVVLLQFEVARGQVQNPEYVKIPVRTLNENRLLENNVLYVPKAANKTLTTMIRQQWGDELGVKLQFPSHFWNSDFPTQEELAAVFDWLSTLRIGNVIKSVVVDAKLHPTALSHFAKANSLYSSVFKVIPGFTGPDLGDIMATRGNEPQPHTTSQRSAEDLMAQVGKVVASHGCFLDLANTGCVARDNIWRAGSYSSQDSYSIRLPRDVQAIEHTGLFVFEELCRRSNNRAGIIVSVPSASYIPSGSCGTPERVNRHHKGSGTTITYSKQELSDMIVDMAKWGVSKYSLGYLDYTFGSPNTFPTFTELASAVGFATRKKRTLHYRYTRNSIFGDGGSATVNGIYKLEGGVFFQKVTKSTPQVKSFMSVPGISHLRLGLSSDMNVGAPLTLTDHRLTQEIETVKFIPYGAHVVDLDYKSAVTFVDQDKDTICVYWPNNTVRSNGTRFPSLGARRTVELQGDRNNSVSCSRLVHEAQHHARLSWLFPVASEYKHSVLGSLSKLQTWLGSSVLTKEERDWLTSTDNQTVRVGSVSDEQNIHGVLDQLHFLSQVFQCIRGSSSCIELGDYVINGWPQGGTGYPIAIHSIDVDTEISVKLIIAANYGSLVVKSPCDITPFSFGSDHEASAAITEGYNTREQDVILSDAIAYAANVEQLTTGIAQRLLSLYCNRTIRSEYNSVSHREYLRTASECVTATKDAVSKSKSFSLDVVATIDRNRDNWRSITQQLAFEQARSAALCLSALLLALLIHAALVATLCNLCKVEKRNTSRFRKVQ